MHRQGCVYLDSDGLQETRSSNANVAMNTRGVKDVGCKFVDKGIGDMYMYIDIYVYMYMYPPPCPRGTKWSASNPIVSWGLLEVDK